MDKRKLVTHQYACRRVAARIKNACKLKGNSCNHALKRRIGIKRDRWGGRGLQKKPHSKRQAFIQSLPLPCRSNIVKRLFLIK